MRRKIVMAVIILVFAGLGAGARYALDQRPQGHPLPIAETQNRLGGVSRVSGPVPPVARPAPAEVKTAMEAMAPASQYPLADWTIDQGSAGDLSSIFIAGPQPAPLGDRPLAGDDVLLLSGWAGDAVLGLRFDQVIFSLCDRVVGWTAVDQPRPDVVRYVHSNLIRAGWSARLPVALLPRCSRGMLEAWAVGPMGVLYPLAGPVLLPGLPPPVSEDWQPPGAPVFRPSDSVRLHQARLDVIHADTPMRRCPEQSCSTLATLPAGEDTAARLDHGGGWTLLMTRKAVGWVENKAFRWLSTAGVPPNLPLPQEKPEVPTATGQAEPQIDLLEPRTLRQ